ncbi:MAG: hypothetical protein L6R42_003331, partial [Xanthoria sp. 1 TBL-2021]
RWSFGKIKLDFTLLNAATDDQEEKVLELRGADMLNEITEVSCDGNKVASIQRKMDTRSYKYLPEYEVMVASGIDTALGAAKVPYPAVVSSCWLTPSVLVMDDIKTMSSFQPASAPAATARSAPSPLSPTTPSEHCLEAIAPQTAPSQKRKLETEDSPTCKRQQLERPPASTPALLPEADVLQQASPDRQDRPSQTEGDTQDHNSQTLEVTQEYDPSTRQNSRDHESEDQSLNRPHQAPSAPLSKANLKLLQQEVAAFEEMDNESASSSQARKRRAPSRQTSNSDLVSGTSGRTKEPTPSHSFYRYNILDHANVYIQSEPPSGTLQAQLDVIFKRKVTDDRKREISDIAKQKSPEFSKLLWGAHREDDLVELVQKALFAIHKDDTLKHPRKADWNLDLKPTIQRQQIWNFDILGRPNVDVNKAPDHSGKRQQADRPFPSPDTSETSMPPPVAPRVPGNTAQLQMVCDGAVKTPRPDFTWGFYQSTITDALMERGLSKLQASGFLAALQRERKLCSDPTQHFLDIRFPILVIEGKAYTTGKTLFEAETKPLCLEAPCSTSNGSWHL